MLQSYKDLEEWLQQMASGDGDMWSSVSTRMYDSIGHWSRGGGGLSMLCRDPPT